VEVNQVVLENGVELGIIQIFIRTISGKTIALEVEPGDTIKKIKEKIQNREGISPKHQRLLFGSKQLEGDHNFRDYDIPQGSTIQLALRLRGGSDHNTAEREDEWEEKKEKKAVWKRNLTRRRNQSLEELKFHPGSQSCCEAYEMEFEKAMKSFENLKSLGKELGLKDESLKLAKEISEIEQKYDDFQDIFESYMKKEAEILKKDSKHSDTDQYDLGIACALPPLELPKFGGNSKDFENWRATINVCIEESRLSDMAKILRLRQTLFVEPLSLIQNLGIVEGAFQKAIQRLDEKYGGEDRTVPNIMKDIQNLQEVKAENIEDFEEVIKILEHLIYLFKSKNSGELGKGAFYHMIIGKFSRSLLINWERELDKIKENDGNSVIENMFWWLKRELTYVKKTEEVLVKLPEAGKKGSISSETEKTNISKRKNTFFSNNEGSINEKVENRKIQCRFCNETHFFNQFDTFKKLIVRKRQEFMTKK